jgi:hypothetical protein
MKKIPGAVIGLIVILIAGLLIGKNIVAKTVISGGVKAVTGLQLDIGRMDVSLTDTLIGINDMKLYNPDEFSDRVMVDLPEIYVDYDLGAFIDGRVHLEEVRINLKELTVVRNRDGTLNLDALKAAKSGERAEEPKEEAGDGKRPEISIDLMKLRIGKAVYKDYSKGGKPRVLEYNIGLDEEYRDITDLDKMAKIILVNALVKTNIAKLTNFDIDSIKAVIPESVAEAAEMGRNALQEGGEKAAEAVGEAQKKALDAFKESAEGLSESLNKLKLPFGRKK